MPFLSIPFILQILLIIHVVRNNRNMIWIFILIFVPIAGGIAYIIVEILPGVLNSRTRAAAASAVTRVIAPERVLRNLEQQVEFSPTMANRKALADEYTARERYSEAIDLYTSCLTGPFENDAEVLLSLSRAQYESGQLDAAEDSLDRVEIKSGDPGAARVLLLRARIMEKHGDTDGAATTFREAAIVGSGLEYQYRHLCYLNRAGKSDEARRVYEEMQRRFQMMPGFSRKLNREWMRLADREARG